MDEAIVSLLCVLITGQFGLIVLLGRQNHKRSNPNDNPTGPILSQLLTIDTKVIKISDVIGKTREEQAAIKQAMIDLSARADKQDKRFEKIEKRIFDGWGA